MNADQASRHTWKHTSPRIWHVKTNRRQSVLLVPLNADHVAAGDPGTYPKTLNLLVDIVATGLTSFTRS